MSSPFVRRSTAITAGAVVLAGLVAIPAASFATPPTGLSGIPVGAIKASRDPDGAGTLYRLTKNVSTYTTVSLPNNATLNGAGHTITAVEDANHPVFPGPVVSAAVGTDTAAAHVDIKNLHITAQGFDGKDKNSGGKLSGIYMFRAGGTLTNVSVAGVWHDSGVQEGDAISVRNKVSEDPSDGAVNVPRARVALKDVHVGAFQKTGIRLDGNVSVAIENTTVGASALQHNPPLAPNGVTIMRGASGTVRHSVIKLNHHVESTAALLWDAKGVVFNDVVVNGHRRATSGIYVYNDSSTLHTTFTMRGGKVLRTGTPAAGTGLTIDGPAYAITARTIGTPITGWAHATSGPVTTLR